jgi:hypothetical protein
LKGNPCRACMLIRKGKDGAEAKQLAGHFCVLARQRIERLFRGIFHNADRETYMLAQDVLERKHGWLESGILDSRGKTSRITGTVPVLIRSNR